MPTNGRRGLSAASFIAGATLLLALPTRALAQSPWPPARAGHAMAYDSRRGLVLMYGDADTLLWGWDGRTWRSFAGPPTGLRKHVRLAYDAARDRLVLFGGATRERAFGDTWEWDGARWRRLTTDGPGARMGAGVAYDSARARVLLFGGVDSAGSFRADTWAWDGRRWTKLADGAGAPPGRAEHGMVYDPVARRALVAGGIAPDGGAVRRDSWAFDGQTWRRLASDASGRWAPLALDPLTAAPLRIGGQADDAVLGDTWRWTPDGWRPVAGATLPPRQSHAAVLDTRRGRVVVFGGSAPDRSTLADLWEWDGHRWEEVKR